MTFDVAEDMQALVVGSRVVVRPEEPKAPMPIAIHQLVDRGGHGSCGGAVGRIGHGVTLLTPCRRDKEL
jgi:hypothetical protein